MDTRATTFPHTPPQPRKAVRRAAKPSEPVDAPLPPRSGPFHAGLSYDGLGAINAARITALPPSDQPAAMIVNASAAEAYRRSQVAI